MRSLTLGTGCALLLLTACVAKPVDAGSSATTAATTTSGGGGAAGVGGAASTGGAASSGGHGGAPDCSGFVPLATPAELATSPRDDADAEWLALEAGDTAVASGALYARAQRDLAAIRASAPELAPAHVTSPFASTEIAVTLDASASALAKQGAFDGWTCPNLAYAAEHVDPILTDWEVGLPPTRRLRYDLVAAQYGGLAHVTHAQAHRELWDYSTICASADGDVVTYVFYEASGECDTICPRHRLRGFTTDAAGAVTAIGDLVVEDPAAPQPPVPAWLAGAGRCTRWLFVCTVGASYCPAD